MSDGLITRIGKWIDYRWAAKITEVQLQELKDDITALKLRWDEDVRGMRNAITETATLVKTPQAYEKEIADLKTRMEKIELYTGITRKVDPTKAAVAKSAFLM